MITSQNYCMLPPARGNLNGIFIWSFKSSSLAFLDPFFKVFFKTKDETSSQLKSKEGRSWAGLGLGVEGGQGSEH